MPISRSEDRSASDPPFTVSGRDRDVLLGLVAAVLHGVPGPELVQAVIDATAATVIPPLRAHEVMGVIGEMLWAYLNGPEFVPTLVEEQR